MNPNDDQPINPIDYLNQIAPQPTKKTDFLKQKPIMIGAIALVVLLVFLIIGMVITSQPSSTKNLESLAAKLVSTKEITKKANINIKSKELLDINSNFDIYLTNTIRDITPILKTYKINISKLDKKVETAESNEEILARLEDARLNVNYDIVYAGEMNTSSEEILILMRKIYKTTKNKDLKSFIETSVKNLEPTQKQFADFNSTNN